MLLAHNFILVYRRIITITNQNLNLQIFLQYKQS